VRVYRDRKSWRALQQICMSKDFSWELSAIAYHQIYKNIISR
jgi:glycogen synthase